MMLHPLLLSLSPQSSQLNVVAHAGLVEEVRALDPTRITMLDAPGDDIIAFDAQFFFDGSRMKQLPFNLFVSAKRQAPRSGDIVDELLCEDHEAARQTSREQGAIQKFSPAFLYVTMVSANKLKSLQRLVNQGQNDILVISEDELDAFLPVAAFRPSLVALTGSKVLRESYVSISTEPA